MSKRTRCAIYTRKSTEEGLEQDFNSLDAQREACVAYVSSQKHEGWAVMGDRFDDGGFSGGTMERPGLKELMELVRANKVDVIVVYKVDRLTRALNDFAKMVDQFDEAGVSFVSVTQQFNTTTSMGRLTLNVLLSFAQFEREVTAERIRDKIAASKKKGMWMGGPSPLGYDVVEKKLIVNEDEVRTVNRIFDLYLELGNVRAVKLAVDREGILTKRRRYASGRVAGGKPITRGNLYQMLSNPIYNGETPHKGAVYPGQHQAIIDPQTWSAAQAQLRDNAVARKSGTNVKSFSLIAGLMYDDTGDQLTPTHSSKNGKRLRYYVSRRLTRGNASDHPDGWRIPAYRLEGAIIRTIVEFLSDLNRVIGALGMTGLSPIEISRVEKRVREITQTLVEPTSKACREIIQSIVGRVQIAQEQIIVELEPIALHDLLATNTPMDSEEPIVLRVPCHMKRRGVEARLIIPSSTGAPAAVDEQLVHLIAKAQSWFGQIAQGSVTSIREIARREKIDEGDVSRFIRVAFLAPDIVDAIVAGRQPVDLTIERLKRLGTLPKCWNEQRRLLGF
jgi:site-specific DNA recombinase